MSVVDVSTERGNLSVALTNDNLEVEAWGVTASYNVSKVRAR